MSAPAISPAPTTGLPGTEVAPGRSLRRWLWGGVVGTAAAGGLHVAVAAEHRGAGGLAVGFFLLAALAQLGVAAWLGIHAVTGLRPDRRIVTTALAGTVALLALYVVAYTTGLLDGFAISDPGNGAHAGAGHGGATHSSGVDPATGVDLSTGVAIRPEGPIAMAGQLAPARHAPGALGSWTVAAEVLTVGVLAALQPASWRRTTVNVLMALGGLAWVLWFTGVLA